MHVIAGAYITILVSYYLHVLLPTITRVILAIVWIRIPVPSPAEKMYGKVEPHYACRVSRGLAEDCRNSVMFLEKHAGLCSSVLDITYYTHTHTSTLL